MRYRVLLAIGVAVAIVVTAFVVYTQLDDSQTASAGVPPSFTVDSTTDAVDAVPGDTICATAGAVCTVRAAIMEANALGMGGFIDIPAGIYTLTIAGNGEDGAATGDLDITTDLNITGHFAAVTTIKQSTNDRVFHIQPGINGVVVIEFLTVSDGAPPAGQGGGGNADSVRTVPQGGCR